MIKNKIKILSTSAIISVFFICNSWAMVKNNLSNSNDFNPDDKSFYRIINKKRFVEGKSAFLDANGTYNNEHKKVNPNVNVNEPQPAYCTNYNSEYTSWHFSKTDDTGSFHIVSRQYKKFGGGPALLDKKGDDAVYRTGLDTDNSTLWNIEKDNEPVTDNMSISFYTIKNKENSKLLSSNNKNDDVILVSNEELKEKNNNNVKYDQDNIKWTFMKLN